MSGVIFAQTPAISPEILTFSSTRLFFLIGSNIA
jgi:hypothetical protein